MPVTPAQLAEKITDLHTYVLKGYWRIDDINNWEVPAVNPYYVAEVVKWKARLAELGRAQKAGPSAVAALQEKEYRISFGWEAKSKAETESARAAYQHMLDLASVWIAPAEHQGLRADVIDHLSRSVEMTKHEYRVPEKLDRQVWFAHEVDKALAEIKRAQDRLAEMIQKCVDNIGTAETLFASLEDFKPVAQNVK